MVPTEINALLYVAEAQGFFGENGLEVTLKEDYDSGATAAAAMLSGEADVASAAEFVIVTQGLTNTDLVSFATIARYENTFIIWPSDSGATTIRDLKGKRIGVTLGTISEFYLGRSLNLNGMDIADVILVDTKAADAEKALADGLVDAVVTWEPWATQIGQHLGEEVITTGVQSGQYAYWNLVATNDWMKSHTASAKRLLASLAQAEEYVGQNEDDAKALVGEHMHFTDSQMDTFWPRYQFVLSLDQSLVAAMEDEARWMVANGLAPENATPSWLDYISEDGLLELRPNAARIIR